MKPYTVCLVFFNGDYHKSYAFHVEAESPEEAYRFLCRPASMQEDSVVDKLDIPGCVEGEFIFEGHLPVVNYRGEEIEITPLPEE